MTRLMTVLARVYGVSNELIAATDCSVAKKSMRSFPAR
jgi:hypothetical protein